MSDRFRRRFVVAVVTGLMVAGCGSGEPKAAPTVTVPVVGADGLTAEQREVADRTVDWVDALYGRGTIGIEKALRGLGTGDYTARIAKNHREHMDDEGLRWLGPYSFEPRTVTIDEDRASVEGCLDLSKVYLVPRRAKTAKGDELNPGGIDSIVYHLEKSGDGWLVSGTGESTVKTPC